MTELLVVTCEHCGAQWELDYEPQTCRCLAKDERWTLTVEGETDG